MSDYKFKKYEREIYEKLSHLESSIHELEKRVSRLENIYKMKLKKIEKGKAYFSRSEIKILRYLKKGPKTQGEICKALNIPKSTVSIYLRILEGKNIVEAKPTLKKGGLFEYSIKKNLPKDVLELIS
jgi:uncharacterized membrane protein